MFDRLRLDLAAKYERDCVVIIRARRGNWV
jgi:hypothetical protein